MTKIKLCGLRRVCDVEAANDRIRSMLGLYLQRKAGDM